jgi:nitroreductase
MDTLELIKKRISANKYDTTRKLSDDELRELVDYATQAPSSSNLQNWRFVAVTRPEDKERLKAVAYGQPKVVDAAATFIVLGDLRGWERHEEVLRRSQEAGILSEDLVGKWAAMSRNAYSHDERAARDEAFRSGSLAAMSLMIAAEAKGYATGPMGGFDPEGVKREFEISDRYVPVMLITVGYPAPGNWPRKPRLGADEVLRFHSGKELG